MFFADLDTECQVDGGPHVRAVGWLSKDHPYPTGPADPAFTRALREHVARAWQPVAAGGSHDCEFCERARAGENVWIPFEPGEIVAVDRVMRVHRAHVDRRGLPVLLTA